MTEQTDPKVVEDYQAAAVELVRAMNLPSDYGPMIEIIARNQAGWLAGYAERNMQFNNTDRLIPFCDAVLLVAIKAAILVYKECSPFLGFQPMKAPVDKAYNLQYEFKDEADAHLPLSQALIEEKVTLELRVNPVEAATKRLGATTTDRGIDELVEGGRYIDILAEQVAEEIRWELIGDVFGIASTSITDASEKVMTPKKLVDHIDTLANRIAVNTGRAKGNFVICSPRTVKLLAKSKDFVATESTPLYPRSIQFVGTLLGSLNVYANKEIYEDETTEVAVGYRGGNGQVDVPYIYSPYVPVMTAGMVMNPVTFVTQLSLMTRHGKSVIGGLPEKVKGDGLFRKYYQSIKIRLPAEK